MSEDKALMKTFGAVIGVLVVIAVVFYFVANVITDGDGDESRNERWDAKVAENIQPAGAVNVGSAPAPAAAPAAASGPRSGEQVVNASCMACHGTGVAGAPKIGDGAAWGPRAAKGIDALVASATNGLNAMPPRGTCADCSEEELKGAIEYMLKQSGQ